MATIDPPRAVRIKTSTGWADLAIKGAPGTNGVDGANFNYRGDYSAAATYNHGDLVVGPDGITYLCVNNGTTGVAPAPWATAWAGVPLPVVNGQWVKGVGGAAVWAPIVAKDVGAVGLFNTPADVKLQYGQTSVAVPQQAGGAQTVAVPLAHPWPNNHFAVLICALWPLSSWGIYLSGWNAGGLGDFSIDLDSPMAQNVQVGYVSFGN